MTNSPKPRLLLLKVTQIDVPKSQVPNSKTAHILLQPNRDSSYNYMSQKSQVPNHSQPSASFFENPVPKVPMSQTLQTPNPFQNPVPKVASIPYQLYRMIHNRQI